MTLQIHVVGVPAPQGSHRAFVVKGRAVVTQDNKRTRPWRQDVTAAVVNAMAEVAGFEPYTGPVRVTVDFFMPRPRYHFRTGKRANELRPDAPGHVDKKPDVDKLARSILDALTSSAVFRDDAQVAELVVSKRYADAATGARITITPLTTTSQSADDATATTPGASSARPDAVSQGEGAQRPATPALDGALF